MPLAMVPRINTPISVPGMPPTPPVSEAPPNTTEAIEDSAAELGFHSVEMALAGRIYRYRNGGQRNRSWQVRIPLSPSEFIQLTREYDTPAQHSLIAPYADSVRRILDHKLVMFERTQAATFSR